METIGLYEGEELSLFGDQLLGLGSPELDSSAGFPDVRDGFKFLEPLDSGFALKPANTTSNLSELLTDNTDDIIWENAGWLNTQLDVFNFQDTPEADDTLHTASISPSPQSVPATETTAEVLSAEDLFNQISSEILHDENNKFDVSDTVLSEVLAKLTDYIADDLRPTNVDLGQGQLSPVSVNDIESLLSEPLSPSASETTDQSFLQSRPDSPSYSSEYEMMKDSLQYSPEKPDKSSSKNRYKPYSRSVRSPTDRKERKKGQNKTAALKYRQKKKNESENIGDTCSTLENRNVELKDKVDSLTREIKYLKELMAEVLKAKGIKLD